MGIGQQQLTGKIATRDLMLRSSTLKQGSLSDKIDCAEVSSFIYDVIAENQKDNARKLLSLALKVRKFSLNANLGGFVNALCKYITGELIDNFIEQLIEKYTTEEQRKAFIQEVCEIVLDPFPRLRVAEKFSQILDKEYVTEEYSNTSLHLAAEQGDLNAVKYFVEKGGDISAQNEMGYTPLHLAAKNGNLDMVKYLIENGANPKAIDNDGKTPLDWAAQDCRLDIVEHLTEEGQQVTTEGQQITGKIPLDEGSGHVDIVGYSTEEGQQVTERTRVTCEHDNTSLHSAAKYGELDRVKCLRACS
ncbi:ankyrin repeat domain-containing protein [Wolbachia endosymbiont (group A) of Barypeithes pellucidus]|uniref:ankyrin repeat domain-containing protein n=1 Tax=Wolbachia endosymbiont (group A) of Barypeithes pellucidus TaxID=3139322 RepID=UPI003CCB0C79